MHTQQYNQKGFALFTALIVVTVVAVAGVVGYVMITKKPASYVDQSMMYSPSPTPVAQMQGTMPPAADPTPVPSVSSSTDLQVIGKELDQTNTGSVDVEFNSMNSSASSL